MNLSYEEIMSGESLLRSAPDARHEKICQRLHEQVSTCVARLTSTRLLAPRSVVQVSAGNLLRPDLALATTTTGKLWLVAEIINARDHHTDTVLKKQLYEEINLPRLWMIDPRYDNVEIYHGGTYGLALRQILAKMEVIEEKLLPGLQISVRALFAEDSG
jgi:Uma2 family endonuclease